MKTVMIYNVFYFFEGIYFWKPLNFECLISEIYSKCNLLIVILVILVIF